MLSDDVATLHRASPDTRLQAPEAVATSSILCSVCIGKGRDLCQRGHGIRMGDDGTNAGRPASPPRRCSDDLRAFCGPRMQTMRCRLISLLNRVSRPVPYIYTRDELVRILDAAGQLRPLEAQSLAPAGLWDVAGTYCRHRASRFRSTRPRLDDVRPMTSCESAPSSERAALSLCTPRRRKALHRYLDSAAGWPSPDDHLFLSGEDNVLPSSMVGVHFPAGSVCGLLILPPSGHADRASMTSAYLRNTGTGAVLTRREAVARHSWPWRHTWATRISPILTGTWRQRRS